MYQPVMILALFKQDELKKAAREKRNKRLATTNNTTYNRVISVKF